MFGKNSNIQDVGSPPRMRGKVFEQVYTRIPFRITPACVGKSIRPSSMASVPWDHPRVCGEKNQVSTAQENAKGSPPRMRGKGNTRGKLAQCDGITPACAGKSWSRRAESRKKRDHPRVCGEKALKSWLMSGDVGSPPRVRGKECSWASMTAFVGITPAYAGKRVTDQNYEGGR